ncbi:MAG TPA: porin family protein [Hanamia sp.]
MLRKIKIIHLNLLVILLLLCGLQSCAQNNIDEPYYKFAFEAGANYSTMNFSKGVPAPATPIENSWKPGISAGIFFKIPLSSNLFLQPGYFYIHRNGTDKSVNTYYSLDYFSFPLLIKYKISRLIDVVAGPQADLLIHANSFYNDIKTDITHDTEERGIGATAGFNIHFLKSLYISGRYMQGLNHIGIGQRSDPKEFKYQEASLLIGFSF